MRLKRGLVTLIERFKQADRKTKVEYTALSLLIISSLLLSLSIALSAARPALAFAFISFLSVIIVIFTVLKGD